MLYKFINVIKISISSYTGWRFFFLPFAFIFLNGISFAQQWEYTYGGSGRQSGLKMLETYDNGFAILGNNPISSTSGQIIFIKTDINGNVLWTKTIGSSLYFSGVSSSFDVTNDGGVVISGATTQYDSMGAAFVLKLDECGEKEWCKIYGLPNDFDRADYILQLTDGNYIVCARHFGTSSPTADRVGLMKLDSAGNILWLHDYSHYFGSDASSLILTSDNGFLITGQWYIQNPGDTTIYWQRTMSIKVDSTGNEEWNVPYGANNYFVSRGAGARETTDGGYLTLCTHRDSLINYKAWTYIFKTDMNGNVQWGRQIGDSISNGEYDRDILALNDSQSVTLSDIWDTANTNVIRQKILKIDTAGNVLDSVTYGYNNTGFLGKLEKTRDGKILVCITKYLGGSNYDIYALKLNENLQLDTMYNISLNYDSLCSTGITTGFISLDTISYVGVPEVKAEEGFLVYPNPATNQLAVSSRHYAIKEIEIFDMLGKKVFNQQSSTINYQLTVDVSKLNAGIYFLRIKSRESRIIGTQKIIISR